ncbi:hypothetical protein F5Y00DRAFT_266403 [Daldinia vernicosa]|uniref:uncharacterized protein n=1 Tax=Daldinia vernicosa TaxID=114800 RepID=UPI002007665E|nr:uncharacterized protein F5Y00DRAFT_266403 [Daldinia vernicosa]KAI0844575.1 hypothetical protein F5Y00DRAFT_266403 [Daldinia vernicosa]
MTGLCCQQYSHLKSNVPREDVVFYTTYLPEDYRSLPDCEPSGLMSKDATVNARMHDGRTNLMLIWLGRTEPRHLPEFWIAYYKAMAQAQSSLKKTRQQNAQKARDAKAKKTAATTQKALVTEISSSEDEDPIQNPLISCLRVSQTWNPFPYITLATPISQ